MSHSVTETGSEASVKREKDLWGLVDSLPGSDIFSHTRLASLVAFGRNFLKNLVGRISLFGRKSLIALHQLIDPWQKGAKDRGRLAPGAPICLLQAVGHLGGERREVTDQQAQLLIAGGVPLVLSQSFLLALQTLRSQRAQEAPPPERDQHLLELAAQVQASRQRVLGPNAGALTTTEDFDAPLPDDFWLGRE